MRLFSKIFRNLAAFFGHPVPVAKGDNFLEGFPVDETFEAMRRHATGTAGWHYRFVLIRAGAQLLYRCIVYSWRALGYLVYRARRRFCCRNQANNQER